MSHCPGDEEEPIGWPVVILGGLAAVAAMLGWGWLLVWFAREVYNAFRT